MVIILHLKYGARDLGLTLKYFPGAKLSVQKNICAHTYPRHLQAMLSVFQKTICYTFLMMLTFST